MISMSLIRGCLVIVIMVMAILHNSILLHPDNILRKATHQHKAGILLLPATRLLGTHHQPDIHLLVDTHQQVIIPGLLLLISQDMVAWGQC